MAESVAVHFDFYPAVSLNKLNFDSLAEAEIEIWFVHFRGTLYETSVRCLFSILKLLQIQVQVHSWDPDPDEFFMK